MKSVLQKYRRCTHCKSLNMSHRLVCYKCRNHLPAAILLEPDEVPGPLIGFGRNIAVAETRTFSRKDIFLNGVFLESDSDSAARHVATIRNISATGAQLWCTYKCASGSIIRLRYPVSSGTRTVECIVKYCRQAPAEAGRAYSIGIEFIGPSPLLCRM
jgi:hypothetical protein